MPKTAEQSPTPVSIPTPSGVKLLDREILTFVKLHPEASPPFRAYGESVGVDLSACLITNSGRPNTAIIGPRMTKAIHTGIALLAPKGFCILVCSRSGMATKSVFVTNAPGVVDPDYTGEMIVLLYNGGVENLYVKHGDRIAQAIVVPFAACQLVEAPAVPETDSEFFRGPRGFGSTGR
jgi:dUTP pyrophosphatase